MQIKKLIIYTTQLKKQIEFYIDRMGFQMIDQGQHFIELAIGDSILRIELAEKHIPYHFAINIPSNRIQDCANWTKARTDLVIQNGFEVHFFDFWDAQAIYFWDADNNLVEFIARQKLEIESQVDFTPSSMLSISEIGMPVNDIKPIYNQLNRNTGLEIHSGNVERFCAIGEEEGLFVIINKAKKKYWFPSDLQPHSADFKVIIGFQQKQFYIHFLNENLLIHELEPNHHSFARLK